MNARDPNRTTVQPSVELDPSNTSFLYTMSYVRARLTRSLSTSGNLLTAQKAEQFINDHPRLDVSLLRLYFVSADLPVVPNPPDDALRSSALWRGYIGTWRLNVDGTLDLLKFTFPHFEGEKIEAEAYKSLDQSGLVVRTFGATAFIPRSLLLEPTVNLETMIGQRFRCEIHDRDEDRGILILREIEPNNGG